ncbi:hypothetical protein D3C80_1437890 [compost metagenome]
MCMPRTGCSRWKCCAACPAGNWPKCWARRWWKPTACSAPCASVTGRTSTSPFRTTNRPPGKRWRPIWMASTSSRTTIRGHWSSICWAFPGVRSLRRTASASPATWPTASPPPSAQNRCSPTSATNWAAATWISSTWPGIPTEFLGVPRWPTATGATSTPSPASAIRRWPRPACRSSKEAMPGLCPAAARAAAARCSPAIRTSASPCRRCGTRRT